MVKIYIVAYDVNENNWHITEENKYIYIFDKRFTTYNNAIDWFMNNTDYILNITNLIREDIEEEKTLNLFLNGNIIWEGYKYGENS